MMDGQTILTFCLAFFVFAASPGPDNLMIFSKTVANGPTHGIAYGLGVVFSIFCFVILAAISLNMVSQYMAENFRIVQYIGSIYLIYTGIVMWRSSPEIKKRAMQGGLPKLFLLGFLLNISNPKMPIFYLALLPGVLGFQPVTLYDTIWLLVIIALVEVVVIGGHVFTGFKVKHAFSDRKKITLLNRGAGALMIGVGVLVASR